MNTCIRCRPLFELHYYASLAQLFVISFIKQTDQIHSDGQCTYLCIHPSFNKHLLYFLFAFMPFSVHSILIKPPNSLSNAIYLGGLEVSPGWHVFPPMTLVSVSFFKYSKEPGSCFKSGKAVFMLLVSPSRRHSW
jgi:hypothetical protein